jgi:hypothetical protein
LVVLFECRKIELPCGQRSLSHGNQNEMKLRWNSMNMRVVALGGKIGKSRLECKN